LGAASAPPDTTNPPTRWSRMNALTRSNSTLSVPM
jgi:hypothetical protein